MVRASVPLVRARLQKLAANVPLVRASVQKLAANAPLVRAHVPELAANAPMARAQPTLLRANIPLIRSGGDLDRVRIPPVQSAGSRIPAKAGVEFEVIFTVRILCPGAQAVPVVPSDLFPKTISSGPRSNSPQRKWERMPY